MPSSVIASYYYEPESRALVVKYLSGAVYKYLDVPEEVYREMKSVMSKGTFLNERIKPNYLFEKLADAD